MPCPSRDRLADAGYRAHRSHRRRGRRPKAQQEVLDGGREHRFPPSAPDAPATSTSPDTAGSSRPSAATAPTPYRRRASTVTTPAARKASSIWSGHRGQPAGGLRQFQVPQLQGYHPASGPGGIPRRLYLHSGRIGMFATKGFKNYAVLNSVQLGRNRSPRPTRASSTRSAPTSSSRWGNAYVEGNLAYLRRHPPATALSGGSIRLVQPLNEQSRSRRSSLNEASSTSRMPDASCSASRWATTFTRRLRQGPNSRPMSPPRALRTADAASAIRLRWPTPVRPDWRYLRTMTLDGSASYDPDGDPITYQWTQLSGPAVRWLPNRADHVHLGIRSDLRFS